MKKYLFAFLLMLFLPTLALAEVSAVDNGYAEKINSYSVDVTLADSGSISVLENISYDFGNNEKHGIFRYIPFIYSGRVGSPRQTISNISVTDINGKALPYTVSDESSNKVIKIGDANMLLSGVQTYNIGYIMNNTISSNPNGDRFLWNAIGTGWTVPMENVLVSLHVDTDQLNALQTTDCYVGAADSTTKCEWDNEGGITRVALSSLKPNAGITLNLLFAKGTFPAPSSLEMFLWSSHWYYWLPWVALIGFFLFWFEKGRDPKGRGTIVPMYDAPKEITPFEASIIMDETISHKSLPAAIIALAIKGYIKIHRKDVKVLFTCKPTYELELLKPIPQTAPRMEQKISDLFFIGRDRVDLNDLGDSFPQLNASVHQFAYKEVTEKGYFPVNPVISKVIFFAVSVMMLVLGTLTAIYFLTNFAGFVCFLAPGFIAFLFAFIMPVRTKEGAILREDLLGLKMYIKAAEIDRIKFHNAPAKSPEKFEELLPYAIIFGLEKEWAAEFKDIYKNPPSWYDGNMATFSVIALTDHLSSFSDSAISAVVSASSSGGGFGGVGGGGGGGGGGSW